MSGVAAPRQLTRSVRPLDCIIVGFNEVDFNEFAQSQQKFAHVSAAYSELKTNSVLHGAERRTYMDLLNVVLSDSRGRPSHLNAFKMPSLGVAYLTSFLRRRGFAVGFVNFFNSEMDDFAAMLAEGCLAVAITTTYYVDDAPIREIIKFVRRHNIRATIVVGGPRIVNICAVHPPATQDLVFRALGADVYVNDSQGERTLAELLECLSGEETNRLESIPNLIYRVDGETFCRTRRDPEDNDLSENAVDWSTFDPSFYTPTAYMRTSRSCAFRCAFCNYPAMAGKLALSELDVIESELGYLCDHGVRNLIFVDDTFNVPLPRFKNICRMLIRNRFDLRWVSFFRCSNADEEAFDLMAESGCFGVLLGIESGDQQILRNMNKSAQVEQYCRGIARLTDRGILTLASLVLGFPGETAETISRTIEFLQHSAPTFYSLQLYYHDKLAPIERQRERFGIEGAGYSWKHLTMDWQQAAEWKEHVIREITESALLPLYGLSIWSLPYLISHGLTVDQIIRFATHARRLLIKGLDTVDVDCDEDLRRLESIFVT